MTLFQSRGLGTFRHKDFIFNQLWSDGFTGLLCLSFCLRDRDACEVIAYGGGSRKDSSELFNQACQHLTVVYERKLVVLPSLFWTSQGTVSIH